MRQQAKRRVGPLFVQRRFDGVDKILLFALDEAGAEAAVLRKRVEQDLLGKRDHRAEHLVPLRQKIVLDKVRVKAGQLDLALFAHERTERCAVQLVERGGDAADVRILLRRPQQNAGQKRIGRSRFGTVRADKIDAEAAGFEFIGLHGPQRHLRCQLKICRHCKYLPFRRNTRVLLSIIHLF